MPDHNWPPTKGAPDCKPGYTVYASWLAVPSSNDIYSVVVKSCRSSLYVDEDVNLAEAALRYPRFGSVTPAAVDCDSGNDAGFAPDGTGPDFYGRDQSRCLLSKA